MPIILIVIVLLVAVSIALIVKKRTTNVQVDLLQARVTELSTVYDEIDLSENMETVNNMSYKKVEKSVKSIPETDGYDVPRCQDD